MAFPIIYRLSPRAVRGIIDDLEIRQLNLLVRERKQRGGDPLIIERSILDALDCIELRAARMETYVKKAREWMRFDWSLLEDLTRKFVPTAEWLLEGSRGMDDADYGPFVIEYSRALENEILMKLFGPFQTSLRGEIGDIAAFLETDISDDDVKSFAKSIKTNRTIMRWGKCNEYAHTLSTRRPRIPVVLCVLPPAP